MNITNNYIIIDNNNNNNNNNNMTTTLSQYPLHINVQMYYEINNELQCNGFYPQLEILKGYNCKIINIEFKYFHYKNNIFGWQQSTGPVIYGFTKKNGQALLNYLNKEARTNAQIITNVGSRTIFPMNYNATFYVLENYSK